MSTTINYGLEKMDYGTTGQNVIHDNNMDILDSSLPNPDQTTEDGESSGAGEVIFSMPFQADNHKRVLIYLDGWDGSYEYTFPTAFEHTPMIISETFDSSALETCVSALSITAVTITGDGETGFIELVGF